MTPEENGLNDPHYDFVQVFARLKAGYTAQSARASLQPLFHQLLEEQVTDAQIGRHSAFDRGLFLKRTVLVERAATGYSDMRQQVLDGTSRVDGDGWPDPSHRLLQRGEPPHRPRGRAPARDVSAPGDRRESPDADRQLLIESLLLALTGAALGLALSVVAARTLIAMLPSSDALIDAARRARPADSRFQHGGIGRHRGAVRGGARAACDGIRRSCGAERRSRRRHRRSAIREDAQGPRCRADCPLVPPSRRRRAVQPNARASQTHRHRAPIDREPSGFRRESCQERLHGATAPSVLRRAARSDSRHAWRGIGFVHMDSAAPGLGARLAHPGRGLLRQGWREHGGSEQYRVAWVLADDGGEDRRGTRLRRGRPFRPDRRRERADGCDRQSTVRRAVLRHTERNRQTLRRRGTRRRIGYPNRRGRGGFALRRTESRAPAVRVFLVHAGEFPGRGNLLRPTRTESVALFPVLAKSLPGSTNRSQSTG